MHREQMIKHIKYSPDIWDVLIIGGGATGLGIAVDAATRGLKTLLVEQSDFAKATSSRSTKLIHGGLRYLKQGNIGLVREALIERGRLCQNAPHLVFHQPFLVPNFHWWETAMYGLGLSMYDMLAGDLGIEKSKHLSKAEIQEEVPNLKDEQLKSGTIYFDGQFDDARLAITLAKTAVDHDAAVINYMKVTDLIKDKGKVSGAILHDEESHQSYEVHAKAVINATGIFTDQIRQMDNPKNTAIVAPSQGIHIVVENRFLDSNTAVIIPHTDDKRIIFIVPWHERLLIGTTDVGNQSPKLEPVPTQEEINFLLEHASRYLKKTPTRDDIKSVFAGLRPLIGSKGKSSGKISREHSVIISPSELITICGGKWTTYRKMAEDVLNKAVEVKKLKARVCSTQELRLHGYNGKKTDGSTWSAYGSEGKKIEKIIEDDPQSGHPIHSNLPYTKAECLYSIRHEMARTIDDILSRRTRSLLLDAKASAETAPMVADLLKIELDKDEKWKNEQIASFRRLTQNYIA
jgi:glycerol-3-phosphate dehydrogenase